MIHYLEPGQKPYLHEITQQPIDVSQALKQLDANPKLWNKHRLRTAKGSPHENSDDIWMRYNAAENLKPGDPAVLNDPHDSVWYPSYNVLTEMRPLIFGLMSILAGERLGGVLITRVPPGKSIKPHRDGGWHAGYYRKFCVQLRGGADQGFHYKGETLVADDGEVYEFDNSHVHWISNDSARERLSLIVCIRTGE